MEGNGWKWIGWQKRLETPYHIMTTYYQVLERDGKVSELDQRTDALQVDFVWYNCAIVLLCAYSPQNNQKSDHFSDCNILIIFTRREQANSGGTPRRLKTREGEEVEVMKWKNHVFFQVGKLEADCNHWCGGRSGRCPNNCLGCPLGSRLVMT